VLKLVSTDPKNGKVSVVDYAQYIKFTFNEPVDLETLVVKITPHVNTRIKAPVNKKQFGLSLIKRFGSQRSDTL